MMASMVGTAVVNNEDVQMMIQPMNDGDATKKCYHTEPEVSQEVRKRIEHISGISMMRTSRSLHETCKGWHRTSSHHLSSIAHVLSIAAVHRVTRSRFRSDFQGISRWINPQLLLGNQWRSTRAWIKPVDAQLRQSSPHEFMSDEFHGWLRLADGWLRLVDSVKFKVTTAKNKDTQKWYTYY